MPRTTTTFLIDCRGRGCLCAVAFVIDDREIVHVVSIYFSIFCDFTSYT